MPTKRGGGINSSPLSSGNLGESGEIKGGGKRKKKKKKTAPDLTTVPGLLGDRRLAEAENGNMGGQSGWAEGTAAAVAMAAAWEDAGVPGDRITKGANCG